MPRRSLEADQEYHAEGPKRLTCYTWARFSVGRVANLFLKRGHGEPMTEVAAVTAISGKGFVGDVSFGRKSRQVLLIDLETLDNFGIRPGDVRENVTLEAFELSALSPNDELTIGETLLAVTGDCEPCSMLDDLRAGLSADIRGRRGILARVIRGGELKVGDSISFARSEPAASAPRGAVPR